MQAQISASSRPALMAVLPPFVIHAASQAGSASKRKARAGGSAAASGPPHGSLSADPPGGRVPLSTTLTHRFEDPQPQTARYVWQWDADGDGEMDLIVNPGRPSLPLTFARKGHYKVWMDVKGKDALGGAFLIHEEVTIKAY